MSLDPVTARRLAFVRYVHRLGDAQTLLPEPQSAVSLLMFHDAVESLLLIVADHYATSANKFEDYWKALKAHVPGELPQFRSMQRLNRSRNDFKHNGVLPSQATISQVKGDVVTFMSATTQAVFNLDYNELSMVDVVGRTEVRDLLRRAQKKYADGDIRVAMANMFEAYEALFKPHESQWLPLQGGNSSPFSFGPRSSQYKASSSLARDLERRLQLDSNRHDFTTQRLAEHIAIGTEIAIASREAVRMTAIGIAYPDYLRFDRLMPVPVDMADGIRTFRAPVGYAPNEDEFAFCLDFVVTASLRLAEAESHQIDPSYIPREANGRVEWENIVVTRWDVSTPE